MNIMTAMRTRVETLAAIAELDVETSVLPSCAVGLSDESVLHALANVTALANDAARLQAVLVGVAAQRSRREDGHGGLAAVYGHATPASLIQSITGGTRADATRHVRVGVSLLEGVGAPSGPVDDLLSAQTASPPRPPWHEPLRAALLEGRVTAAQHDAIRGGLGQPPVSGDDAVDSSAVEDAWALAAVGLVADAAGMPVEELAKRARTVRDLLDPTGAEGRYARRYDNRSLRMWVDRDGQHHARITFDDEMGLWVRSMLDAAMRPRRGGPRFVTDQDRAAAQTLRDDPRSNEQLDYDLLVDVLCAGSLATARDVFGARQPGVRVLIVNSDASGTGHADPRDAFGRLLTLGYAEDGGQSLPGSVVDRSLCQNGSIDITMDSRGNPLDVGREQRLYTPRQRIALAARDGGCRWPECTRPASYCEAHHSDRYSDGGRTDIDRGILLCRFHHTHLHTRGWKITREAHEDFLLHPPPEDEGEPIILPTKAPWKHAWNPPTPPSRTTWRAA